MQVSYLPEQTLSRRLEYVISACFNVCTGDIEDAPAPSPLHSFKTSVVDGKIFVTADSQRTSKANMARSPKVSPESASGNSETALSSGMSLGVVIVGGGSATFHAVDSLREVISCLHVFFEKRLISAPERVLWSHHHHFERISFPNRQVISLLTLLLRRLLNSCLYRTKLSKALVADPAKLELRTAADLRIKLGTTLRTSTVNFALI